MEPTSPSAPCGQRPDPLVLSLTASNLKKSRKLLTVDSRMDPLTRIVFASSRCSSCTVTVTHMQQMVEVCQRDIMGLDSSTGAGRLSVLPHHTLVLPNHTAPPKGASRARMNTNHHTRCAGLSAPARHEPSGLLTPAPLTKHRGKSVALVPTTDGAIDCPVMCVACLTLSGVSSSISALARQPLSGVRTS